MFKVNSKAINCLCFVVLIFLGIYIAAFQRILDVIALNFLLSEALMGFVVTAHFLGSFFSPLIAGELSDKYGRKHIIANSLIVFLIVNRARKLTGSYPLNC